MPLCELLETKGAPVATARVQCIHAVGHSIMFNLLGKAMPRAQLGSACVQPLLSPDGPDFDCYLIAT